MIEEQRRTARSHDILDFEDDRPGYDPACCRGDLRGGQIATQALAAGDPPIVNIGTVVQANLQGDNLALVAAVQSKYDFYVFSRPELTRFDQVTGKRLGVTNFGSASHNASTVLLRHLNLEPNKDVMVMPAGVESEQIAAVLSGKIDLALFTSVVGYRARKAGLHELFYIGDLTSRSRGNGLATNRSYVQSHRETVKAAVKGYVEAIPSIYANKKDALRIFAKYLRSDDPEFLDYAHQLYVKLIPKKPTRRSRECRTSSTCLRCRFCKRKRPNWTSLSI